MAGRDHSHAVFPRCDSWGSTGRSTGPQIRGFPRTTNPQLKAVSAWLRGSGCPQRDSNPRYHLERVATWAASRWGRPSEDTRGRSYHPWPPGRLAQLVERLPYTQVAAGSSPAPPTHAHGACRGDETARVRRTVR